MAIRTYSESFSTRKTSQSERIPGRKDQVKNSAGGFVFEVDEWDRLDRFLVLGTEGGTYYIGEKALTKENAKTVLRLIEKDGTRVVDRVVEISKAGRAPSNDSAIFVLAMAMKMGDEVTRKAAHAAVPEVCRIGTHIFQLAEAVKAFGGWGRATKRAFGEWYTEKDPDKLAYQVIKYRQREGWAHRDILRKAHPPIVDKSGDVARILGWAVGKSEGSPHTLIQAFEEAQKAKTSKQLVSLISKHSLPREAIPTDFLNDPSVWDALLREGQGMPLGAMVRSLGKMTSVGLLKPMSDASRYVRDRLGDEDAIKRARLHPLAILFAVRTYASGKGFRGSLAWDPDTKIVNALDGAFYSAFGAVEPTNKRWLLALDVSGSMGVPIKNSNLSCMEASCAMALVTAAVEEDHHIVGFATSGERNWYSRDAVLKPLDITPRQRLDDAVSRVRDMPFGGTDCALPMIYALKNKIAVDTFVIYTDSETWAGDIHPVQALQKYRREMGVLAKLVVVGMVSNGFTIADPNDAGMLDVVGFDASAPALISDFAK